MCVFLCVCSVFCYAFSLSWDLCCSVLADSTSSDSSSHQRRPRRGAREARGMDVYEGMVAMGGEVKVDNEGDDDDDDDEGEEGASGGRKKRKKDKRKKDKPKKGAKGPPFSMFSADTLLKLFGVSSRHWEADAADAVVIDDDDDDDGEDDDDFHHFLPGLFPPGLFPAGMFPRGIFPQMAFPAGLLARMGGHARGLVMEHFDDSDDDGYGDGGIGDY